MIMIAAKLYLKAQCDKIYFKCEFIQDYPQRMKL